MVGEKAYSTLSMLWSVEFEDYITVFEDFRNIDDKFLLN